MGLHPDQDYDSHGVYSGGALVENGNALLFFTGNKRDENWQRVPTQCFARCLPTASRKARRGY
ncbi:hypothetical protein OK016_29710 [Vibrio chagasii]|nr:hypothetical protein [Vibrio chagasii]